MRDPATGLKCRKRRLRAGPATRLRTGLAAVALGFPLLSATPAGASETITYS